MLFIPAFQLLSWIGLMSVCIHVPLGPFRRKMCGGMIHVNGIIIKTPPLHVQAVSMVCIRVRLGPFRQDRCGCMIIKTPITYAWTRQAVNMVINVKVTNIFADIVNEWFRCDER